MENNIDFFFFSVELLLIFVMENPEEFNKFVVLKSNRTLPKSKGRSGLLWASQKQGLTSRCPGIRGTRL